MRGAVFQRLNEHAASPVFWTAADVNAAIDDGYAELADASEFYEQWFEIPLLGDRPYYDLRTQLTPDILAVGMAYDETSSRWLLPTSVSEFDASDPRWERVVGQPQRFLLRGLWWLGYWPRVHGDTGHLVKQYYTALPPRLGDTDEPLFPSTFHLGCVEFALTELWAQDGETKAAMDAWAAYLAIEAGLVSWVNGRAGMALRPVMSSLSGGPR